MASSTSSPPPPPNSNSSSSSPTISSNTRYSPPYSGPHQNQNQESRRTQFRYQIPHGHRSTITIIQEGSGKFTGIRFDRDGHESETLYSSNQEVLRLWKNSLEQRINQRGFHELFKPIKKIGKGNFASVYLAERKEDGRMVAVKAFSKELTFSQEKGKESLINEIKLLRKLNHPHVLKLHAVFESENSIYMTLELLEGGQLYDKIQSRHKFTPQEVLQLMKSLL